MQAYDSDKPFLLKERKNIIAVLRLIVFSIIYLIVFNERGLTNLPGLFWVITVIFFLSEILCVFEHHTCFFIQRVLGSIFIFDAILISLIIYILAIKPTQLFIAYFAVIALAAISKSVGTAFVISIIVSVFYFFTALHQEEFALTEFLTRPLFFFGVALFSGYLSEEVNAQYREKKKVKEQLKESEELFKGIFDSATDGILLADVEAKKFYVGNKMICQMIGYGQEEIKQLGVMDIHPKEDLAYVIGEFEKQAKRKITLAKDIPVKRKDGTVFYADVNSTPIILNGRTYLMGIFRDITERKQAEALLRTKEHKYRTLLENLPQKVFYKDKGLVYVSCNENYARDLNIKSYEIAGKTDYDFYPKELADKYRTDDKRIMESDQVEDIEEKYIRDGQERFVHTVKTPVKDANGRVLGILGIFWDITEQKKAEDEKKKIQAQLFQSQKMEAIGTLAGGIAHDFNNLLTVIQGYAEMLMMEMDKKGSWYESLENINDAATRAADLTRQLLVFGRKQPIKTTALKVNQTITDLLKMLKRLIGENITIETELASDIWTIQADKGNLEQIIMNLVVNARDAMPQGGKITIKTKNATIDKEYCRVNSEARPGQFMWLSITDTGTGMDKETIGRLFEPFFSTKEVGKGTGLGLPVVYGIIKQHQGWVNVYSEPGHGTIFNVYLPVLHTQTETRTEETIPAGPLQGRGERILLVEDEKPVLEFTKKILEKNNYVVFTAASVKEAEDVFKREKGGFRLVFSDTVLPDESGLTLVSRLLARHPELPVLMSSGYTNDKVHRSFPQEKQFPFLQKPYSINSLLRMVREVIESRS